MAYQIGSLSMHDRLQLLRLWRTENVGPISFFHLLKRYGNVDVILERLNDIMRRNVVRIPSLESAQREWDAHQAQGFHLVSYYDHLYPSVLRSLRDAPAFLTLCGRSELLNSVMFSIVGSRSASHAGERFTMQLAHELSLQKWVIVSGLARGVDACAHKASVDNAGTIAVVVGGMGHIYPPENKALYQEIKEKGLLISEDPLDQEIHGGLFPKRNRLISGLSWGTLIVEASAKSGSLMTARYASEQGRSVFAVPGHPMDYRARGTNRLIKQGACLVESSDDIFSEYALSHRYVAEPESEDFDVVPLSSSYSLSEPKQDLHTAQELVVRIQNALTLTPVRVDDLAQNLQESSIVVRIALVDMELNGEIQFYPGDCVMRAP